MEPFLLRALAAGLGLAAMAAPLGCFLVWQRMAFFGETVAQASLIGVAIGLALQIDVTLTVLAASLAIAFVLIALGRQKLVPVDTLLSVLAHSALAAGVLATALVKGRSVDLMSYLFGDILAVTHEDLLWLAASGILVIAVLSRLWQPMLSLAVHEELAAGGRRRSGAGTRDLRAAARGRDRDGDEDRRCAVDGRIPDYSGSGSPADVGDA